MVFWKLPQSLILKIYNYKNAIFWIFIQKDWRDFKNEKIWLHLTPLTYRSRCISVQCVFVAVQPPPSNKGCPRIRTAPCLSRSYVFTRCFAREYLDSMFLDVECVQEWGKAICKRRQDCDKNRFVPTLLFYDCAKDFPNRKRNLKRKFKATSQQVNGSPLYK